MTEKQLQQLREKLPNFAHGGPHFGSEDTNVVGFFRGYMETLPGEPKTFKSCEEANQWAGSHWAEMGYPEGEQIAVRDKHGNIPDHDLPDSEGPFTVSTLQKAFL